MIDATRLIVSDRLRLPLPCTSRPVNLDASRGHSRYRDVRIDAEVVTATALLAHNAHVAANTARVQLTTTVKKPRLVDRIFVGDRTFETRLHAPWRRDLLKPLFSEYNPSRAAELSLNNE
jgi:hypothetical protein